jgi:predicted DNA-binding protein (MmcQ/YjbR family)
MNREELRTHCLSVKGAEECFDKVIINYKVMGKVFAFLPIFLKDNEDFVVTKCDPEKSVVLREAYAGITKGYYTGSTLGWNSIYLEKDVPDTLIIELVQQSVDEVIKQLSKKKQEEYYHGYF